MITSMRNTGTGSPVIPDWSFGDRLRKVRRDVAQLEQGKFAEQLEVGLKAYSAWESGRTVPRELVAIAKRIEVLTGVPATWMLGIEEHITVPARTGTDSVTGGNTRRYSAGNGARIIPFPQGRPSQWRYHVRKTRPGERSTRAIASGGHPLAAAAR